MSLINGKIGAGLELFFNAMSEEKIDLILTESSTNHNELKLLICDIFAASLEVAEKIVDSAPITLKESITKTEAESLKEKFEGVGTTVELSESAKFSVTLTDLGTQSVKVIKILSELLKISSDTVMNKVENLPFIISETASRLEAEKIVCKLESVGATVNTQKQL